MAALLAAFTYDGYNRLVQSSKENTRYTYDALGRRIRKANQNGLSTIFHYGQNGELLFEKDQSGNTKAYVWLDGRPLARIDNNKQIYYYHVDHLGTPQAMTNSTGAVVWKADYEPFGKATVSPASTVENNLRFPGQYYDRETGLHYNYFRDYDPRTGRYVEVDPIGLEGGINLYAYAEGNPLRYSDPLGLWVKRCARGLGDKNNPPKKPSGNPVRHDYLSVSGQILSFQAGDSMAWSQGFIDDNEYPGNPKCNMVCDDDKFDRYVFEAANEIGAPTYCLTAYPGSLPHILGARNCQTWADDVLRKAKEKYLATEKCPKCFK